VTNKEPIYKKITDKVILDLIRRFVEDNSGGIKFMELISHLMMTILGGEDTKFIGMTKKQEESFPDRIEALIRKSKEFKILDYTWRSGIKAKMFVYTE
jgi:ribosomal protein S6E (S10)